MSFHYPQTMRHIQLFKTHTKESEKNNDKHIQMTFSKKKFNQFESGLAFDAISITMKYKRSTKNKVK